MMISMRCMSLSRTRIAAFAALAALGLAGCESPVPRAQFPQLAYRHLPAFSLDVARIEVVDEYAAPGARPNVEHLFPIVPARVMERWAGDRLRAVGATRRAVFHIRTASVVETSLRRMGGVRGAFTTEQTERYDAVLDVMVEIVGGDGRREAVVESRAERSRTVPEDITLNDREKMWFELVESLMTDLNASLDRQIRANFGTYLR